MDKGALLKAVKKAEKQSGPATSTFVSGGAPRVRQPDPDRAAQLGQAGGTIPGSGDADQASRGGTLTGPDTTTPPSATPPA